MWAKLLLIFTIVPIIELTLLITLGDKIGLEPTLLIVLTTALLGATLGKFQGGRAWRSIKQELGSGKLPQDSLLDGLAVVVASAFLVTPGVLTDFAAFSLLIPFTRAPIKRFVRARVEKWLGMGSLDGGFMGGFGGFAPPDDFEHQGAVRFDHGEDDEIYIEPAPAQERHVEKSESAVVIDIAQSKS